MDRREARFALQLARQWHDRKLLPTPSLAVLEKEYGAAARDTSGESFGSSVLYGLGGILVGAAAFALLVLLRDNGVITDLTAVAPWLLLVWGVLCLGLALAVDLGLRRLPLAESFYVASLVAITASGFPRADELPLGFIAVAYGVGLLAYRRTRFMLPFLALVATNVAYASIVWGLIERVATDETAMAAWFIFALAQVGALVAVGRLAKWPWPTFSLSAATLLLAGTFLGFYFDAVDEAIGGGFQGDAEVFLALLMGGTMAAGFALREKGMVLASALVVAIDAIVFAFDVGELVGGLVAILAVAALLIWQAGSLRRYLRE